MITIPTENNFIKEFKEELEKVKNKEFLIQNEIRQIEIFTSKRDGEIYSSQHTPDNRTNSVFDLSYYGSIDLINETFHHYSIYGSIDDFNRKEDYSNEYTIKNGILLAEYYFWLKELKITPKSDKKYTSLNNDQKLLALHFLGLDLRDYTKTHVRKVLGEILNIGNENIRKNLSVLQGGKNNLRTEDNFKKLLELFENKTFESIQNKIKKELKDLS